VRRYSEGLSKDAESLSKGAEESGQQGPARNRKENSSSLVSETSQVHESSNTACPNIEAATDTCEGQETPFCEGACQCWYHRWCVGVTQVRFQPLSESPESFLCPACIHQPATAESSVEELQGCVRALTAEILELKATVSGLQRTAVASTNEQPTTRVNTKAAEETGLLHTRLHSVALSTFMIRLLGNANQL